MFKRVYTSAWMRAFLSEERNVLRIRAAKSFGECGGPGRGGGGVGIFRRHYRGHCPPEIIKLKSNYGLIIVNPPPIPKAFCARNLDGIEGRGRVRRWGGLPDEWRVSGNVRMNCSKRGIYRYNAITTIIGARNSSPWMLLPSCGDFAACDRFRSGFARQVFRGVKQFRFSRILRGEIDR